MRNAGDLHIEIEAVCPILGVSVGDPLDRSTWSFTPDPSATAQQITAGQQVLSTFDLTATGPDTLIRTSATGEVTQFNPATMVTRNAVRVIFTALASTVSKINEIISTVNSKLGTTIQPLANRTWPQVVAAVKASIQSETDPNN